MLYSNVKVKCYLKPLNRSKMYVNKLNYHTYVHCQRFFGQSPSFSECQELRTLHKMLCSISDTTQILWSKTVSVIDHQKLKPVSITCDQFQFQFCFIKYVSRRILNTTSYVMYAALHWFLAIFPKHILNFLTFWMQVIKTFLIVYVPKL